MVPSQVPLRSRDTKQQRIAEIQRWMRWEFEQIVRPRVLMFTQFLHEMGIFAEPYVSRIFMENNPYIRLESLTI